MFNNKLFLYFLIKYRIRILRNKRFVKFSNIIKYIFFTIFINFISKKIIKIFFYLE